MSLRPELEFVKALLPHRSIDFASTLEGETTMSSTEKSLVLRLAERREERLRTRAPWGKRAMVIGIAGVSVMSAGVALAAWTSTGQGTAAATATTDKGLSAVAAGSVTAPTASPLYPGATAPAYINVHNNNPYPVVVKQVVLTQASNPAVGGSPKNGTTCTPGATAVTLVGATATPSPAVTISPSSDAVVPVPNAVTMGTTSDDGCQGATFTFPSTAASVSAASQ
jgi:hypothetical protein